jgi:CHAT domain-containing protein
VLVPVPVTQKDLRNTARRYVELVSAAGGDPKETKALSAKLYGWLVGPVLEKLVGCDTVVVVPWDVLYYVPFNALNPEGGDPLGAGKRVVVGPSAGVYRYVEPKRAAGHERLVALGNPKTELIPLKQAEQEVKTIQGQFKKAQVYLTEKATETTVKTAIQGTDVVHFACHGMLNDRNPELSYLALTADAANDGRLEVHEVFGLDWKGVSLVTLSACSSGTGKLGAGNDIIGLTRGFMFAGAPSVLATLWEVDDESTRMFMEEFYKHYTVGKSKPEAFQLAQAKLSEDPKWSHPYYWAPFVLWGDWK